MKKRNIQLLTVLVLIMVFYYLFHSTSLFIKRKYHSDELIKQYLNVSYPEILKEYGFENIKLMFSFFNKNSKDPVLLELMGKNIVFIEKEYDTIYKIKVQVDLATLEGYVTTKLNLQNKLDYISSKGDSLHSYIKYFCSDEIFPGWNKISAATTHAGNNPLEYRKGYVDLFVVFNNIPINHPIVYEGSIRINVKYPKPLEHGFIIEEGTTTVNLKLFVLSKKTLSFIGGVILNLNMFETDATELKIGIIIIAVFVFLLFLFIIFGLD